MLTALILVIGLTLPELPLCLGTPDTVRRDATSRIMTLAYEKPGQSIRLHLFDGEVNAVLVNGRVRRDFACN